MKQNSFARLEKLRLYLTFYNVCNRRVLACLYVRSSRLDGPRALPALSISRRIQNAKRMTPANASTFCSPKDGKARRTFTLSVWSTETSHTSSREARWTTCCLRLFSRKLVSASFRTASSRNWPWLNLILRRILATLDSYRDTFLAAVLGEKVRRTTQTSVSKSLPLTICFRDRNRSIPMMQQRSRHAQYFALVNSTSSNHLTGLFTVEETDTVGKWLTSFSSSTARCFEKKTTFRRSRVGFVKARKKIMWLSVSTAHA